MADSERPTVPQPETEPAGCLPMLLRLVWMMVGNVALFISAAFVAKGTAPGIADLIFGAVVVGLVVIRYVDITKFKGETSEGKPATIADWRRYALGLVVISSALWAVARFAASHHWV